MSASLFPAGLSDLLIDVQNAPWEAIERSLARRPELVNAEHVSGTTPLYFAVRHQRPETVDRLIDRGADVNPRLPGRESLLEMADPLPSQDVYDSLRAAGAKPKTTAARRRERLPIYPTIWDLQPAELPLCEAVGDPQRFAKEAAKLPASRLRVLLSRCCEEREERLGLCLIDVLPSVDYCTDAAGSPLLSAAAAGSVTLVTALRAAGAKKNEMHAFHFACLRGHLEVAKLLLEIVPSQLRAFWAAEIPTLAGQAAKKGYTQMAELLLPLANPKTAAAARRQIAAWRRHYEDLAPECFEWDDDL